MAGPLTCQLGLACSTLCAKRSNCYVTHSLRPAPFPVHLHSRGHDKSAPGQHIMTSSQSNKLQCVRCIEHHMTRQERTEDLAVAVKNVVRECVTPPAYFDQRSDQSEIIIDRFFECRECVCKCLSDVYQNAASAKANLTIWGAVAGV